MSYQNKPLASLIASYKQRRQPYSDYLRNLAALANELRELRTGKVWDDCVEMCRHYVYVYTDPRKPKGRYSYRCPSGKRVIFDYPPVYVGKGTARRLDDHLNAKNLRAKTAKSFALKAIRAAGFDPRDYRVVTPSLKTDFMAQALEIDLIAGIGRKDRKLGPLTNGTDGGDGAAGAIPSAESNRKRSLAHTGLSKGLGVRKSDSHRASIRKAALRRPKLECPHCGKHTACNVAHKYHFDRCLLNPELTRREIAALMEERRGSAETRAKISMTLKRNAQSK